MSRSKPPEGDDWLHEIAIAGVRVLARNERSKIQLYSDRGTPLPAKAARKDKPIGDAVRMLPAETLLVDGIVAPLTEGSDKLGYFLFDLPYLDGHDLSGVPLERRKALLEELVRRAGQGRSATSSTSRAAATGFLSGGVPAGDRGDGFAEGGVEVRREGGVGDGRVQGDGKEEDPGAP